MDRKSPHSKRLFSVHLFVETDGKTSVRVCTSRLSFFAARWLQDSRKEHDVEEHEEIGWRGRRGVNGKDWEEEANERESSSLGRGSKNLRIQSK